jgi:hypothetical protein
MVKLGLLLPESPNTGQRKNQKVNTVEDIRQNIRTNDGVLVIWSGALGYRNGHFAIRELETDSEWVLYLYIEESQLIIFRGCRWDLNLPISNSPSLERKTFPLGFVT